MEKYCFLRNKCAREIEKDIGKKYWLTGNEKLQGKYISIKSSSGRDGRDSFVNVEKVGHFFLFSLLRSQTIGGLKIGHCMVQVEGWRRFVGWTWL